MSDTDQLLRLAVSVATQEEFENIIQRAALNDTPPSVVSGSVTFQIMISVKSFQDINFVQAMALNQLKKFRGITAESAGVYNNDFFMLDPSELVKYSAEPPYNRVYIVIKSESLKGGRKRLSSFNENPVIPSKDKESKPPLKVSNENAGETLSPKKSPSSKKASRGHKSLKESNTAEAPQNLPKIDKNSPHSNEKSTKSVTANLPPSVDLSAKPIAENTKNGIKESTQNQDIPKSLPDVSKLPASKGLSSGSLPPNNKRPKPLLLRDKLIYEREEQLRLEKLQRKDLLKQEIEQGSSGEKSASLNGEPGAEKMDLQPSHIQNESNPPQNQQTTDDSETSSEVESESEDDETKLRAKKRALRAQQVNASRTASIIPDSQAESQASKSESELSRADTRLKRSVSFLNANYDQASQQPDNSVRRVGRFVLPDESQPDSKTSKSQYPQRIPGIGGFESLANVSSEVHDASRPRAPTLPKKLAQSSDEESEDSENSGSDVSSDTSSGEEGSAPKPKRKGAINYLKSLA